MDVLPADNPIESIGFGEASKASRRAVTLSIAPTLGAPPERPPAAPIHRCDACDAVITRAVSAEGQRVALDYDPILCIPLGRAFYAPEIVGRDLVPGSGVAMVHGWTAAGVRHLSAYVTDARPDLPRTFIRLQHRCPAAAGRKAS